MEANRDESLRCIDLAKNLLRDGDLRQAAKFLRKAIKLCNTEEIASVVNSLLADCQSTSKQNGSAYCHSRDGSADEDGGGNDFSATHSQPNVGNVPRRRSKSRKRSTSARRLHVDYSEEDVQAVQRILRSKDYYEILSLSRTFAEIDLKKQYRKLALQFHPDKNHAPGATEAFKAIGNAYAVLSDSSKRERYDAFGHEDGMVPDGGHGRRRRYAGRDYTRGFEADMTAEEIFHMFFGGAFPSHQIYRRDTFYARHDRADGRNQTENSLGALVQLLPLLFVVLLTVVGQLLTPDPAFSLVKTGKYTELRHTGHLAVPYYVQSDFKRNYKTQQSRQRVEIHVEQEYLDNLKVACMREQNQKENMIWRANAMGNQEMLNKAHSLTMPSCKKIQEIYAA